MSGKHHRWGWAFGVVVLSCTFAAVRASASDLYYVDDSAPGGDGSTWRTAFTHLQDALLVAGDDDEIRVGQGTYYPDRDVAHAEGTGDRQAAFHLPQGVRLYGGYAGYDSHNPDERDVDRFISRLSGDLANDDGLGCNGVGDNSYHVLVALQTDETTILDGFLISGGNASDLGGEQSTGGGLLVRDGGLRVNTCRFVGNRAGFGGAVCSWSGSVLLIDCLLAQNTASSSGGGIFAFVGGGERCLRCTFHANAATSQGGAVSHCDYGDAHYMSCGFYGNSAAGFGGGAVLCNLSEPTFTNCIFSGNTSNSLAHGGGGLRIESSTAQLCNCTFSGNSASVGGGFLAAFDSAPILVNCILWGNVDGGGTGETAQLVTDNGPPTVDYCDIQGWTGAMGGEGNMGCNPCFADANGPDNILGTPDDLLRPDLCAGLCIDAGSAAALPPDSFDLDGDGNLAEPIPYDFAGTARVQGTEVDMGALEATGPVPLMGDANCDGVVDMFDISPFVLALVNPEAWRDTYAGEFYCINDLTGDGIVNNFDIRPFVALLNGD